MKNIILNLFICFIISNISAGDYIISTSGSYAIQNIIVSSQPANGTSIVIESSNVQLDLCGNTVIGNSNANLTGIFIAPNLVNVIIRGGNIFGFSGNGVTISAGCQRICLENLVIDNCAQRGINCPGISASPIRDLIIRNCRVSNCSTDATLSDFTVDLENCINANIKGLDIDSTNNSALAIRSLNLSACSSSILKKINITNNTAPTYVGVNITAGSQRLLLKDILVELNAATINGLTSFNIDGGILANGIICQNCMARANTSANGFNGFLITDTVVGGIFNGCIVEGNTAAGVITSVGFQLSNSVAGANARNIFKNCIVNLNTTSGAAIFRGFDLVSVNFQIIDNCIFSNNKSTGGTCVGLRLAATAPASSDCLVDQCQAFGNVGSSNANSQGIQASGTARNLFTRNVSYANELTAPGNITAQLPGVGSSCLPAAGLTTNLSTCSYWQSIGGVQ